MPVETSYLASLRRVCSTDWGTPYSFRESDEYRESLADVQKKLWEPCKGHSVLPSQTGEELF